MAAVPDANLLWDSTLPQRIYLGHEGFVACMQALAETRCHNAPEIPKVQRPRMRTRAKWLASDVNREDAHYQADTTGAISMTAIAREPGLSASRVSRMIERAGGH
jgi:putative transposase